MFFKSVNKFKLVGVGEIDHLGQDRMSTGSHQDVQDHLPTPGLMVHLPGDILQEETALQEILTVMIPSHHTLNPAMIHSDSPQSCLSKLQMVS